MTTNEMDTPTPRQVESIKFGNLLINFTTEFQRIWDSKGSDSAPASFWRPAPAPDLLPGFFPLGDVFAPGFDNINENSIVAVVCEGDPQPEAASQGKALSPPDDYEQVWRDTGSGANADLTVWRPIPPSGYVALGMVCSNGRDKPLLNAVRCVRADLVIESSISRMAWSDRRSGAKQNFSAWTISPPSAVAGEIYFSPGTFVGTNSFKRPAAQGLAYSLRMQIPLVLNPPLEAPTLSGFELPATEGVSKVTQVTKLPWFTVIDPNLSSLQQLRSSTSYRLERTDRYRFVGHGHNTSTEAQTFKWTALRAQSAGALEAFADLTAIKFEREWPYNVTNLQTLSALLSSPISFSARLSTNFMPTATSSSAWGAAPAVEVISKIPRTKSVAVYLIQSDYRLLRKDGTQLAIDISYADIDSLYLTEYPPEKDSEGPITCIPTANSATVTDTAP